MALSSRGVCGGLGVYVVGLSLMMVLEAVSMVQRAASHVRKGHSTAIEALGKIPLLGGDLP